MTLRRALLAAAFALQSAAAFAQSAPSASGFIGQPLVAQGAHVNSGGSPSPTLSTGCGTNAVATGTDFAGHLALGTATSQPCTITWTQPYKAANSIDATRPTCIVSSENYQPSFSLSLTALTLTSLIDRARVYWECFGKPGM